MLDPRPDRFTRSHLKIRQLVLLVELGKHSSILQAAQGANLTQSAASRLLADTEHALGVKLFERQSRGVTPTWYGEVMIRRAGAALAELDAGHQEVMELLAGLSGRVAVGSILTPSTTLLPAAVAALQARQPGVDVDITVDTSKPLIQQLRGGHLDLMLGRVLDASLAGELSFEPLTGESHSLIARAGHPLAARHDLSLAELSAQAWVLPPSGSILRDRLTALFLSAGLSPPRQAVQTLALPVVTSLLVQSDMVAALPEELVQPYLDAGVLTVLGFDLGLRMDAYGIVMRRGHRRSPSAELLLTCLRDEARRRVFGTGGIAPS
ncbi:MULTISPECIES: LysR family transcriptional regulator [Roseateles]|uniref:DNA-binding transcriptional LysR family regulator n=1 Tax=Pelomonas aquatica TaxID=431058 RepID=A0ABU1ZFP8_9BURK|nr:MULTISPECIES: LysR family transcriptional regulator [Roseateles]KQY82324.1 galactose-binding protein [Pelomonas sp. Root1444]MDR7299448.1 DNA-binding transcriptional LysR family regulator [Pelomonas aquatica]